MYQYELEVLAPAYTLEDADGMLWIEASIDDCMDLLFEKGLAESIVFSEKTGVMYLTSKVPHIKFKHGLRVMRITSL